MSTKLCAILGCLVNLELNILELNIVEVRLYFKVEGLLLIDYELPDRGVFTLVSLCDKQELREEVLLGLSRHDN